MHRPAIAPIIALLTATPATAQIAGPERQAILADVDARSPDLAKTALAIWNAPEVGYQETKSSALLQAELKRAGFTVPLLIGGATTSPAHSAVKVAPEYPHGVVHVLDASRVVNVVSASLSCWTPSFIAAAFWSSDKFGLLMMLAMFVSA